MENEPKGKVKGGLARAASLTSEQRKEIAQKAAAARWSPLDVDGIPEALYEGILELPGVILECYVWKDRGRVRRVFHKRGLARIFGIKSGSGAAFMRTVTSKGLGPVILDNLQEKLLNPLILITKNVGQIHTYDYEILIDICGAILQALKGGKLHPSQKHLAIQAEIILRSCAKVGLAALIDEATGYAKDKRKEEYRELFKEFIREECKEWEKEFPNQFYDTIYKLYNLRRNPLAKNHPQFFGGVTTKYIYAPLAHSNGAILEMLKEKNPVVYASGGRKYKLHQFLSDIGAPALRAMIWQFIGIGNASRSKESFDKAFNRAFPSSGYQFGLFDDFEDY